MIASSSSAVASLPDAAPAPAPGRLHQHRVADLVREPAGLGGARHLAAAQDRRPRPLGLEARRELVPRELDRAGRRADERDPVLARAAGEPGAFRQKPVPGMDRVTTRAERRLHDRVVAQVALGRRAGTEHDDPVGAARGEPVAIGLGGGDHRFEAELLAGAHDPERDLAAVGDQDALHRPARVRAATGFTGQPGTGARRIRPVRRCERRSRPPFR